MHGRIYGLYDPLTNELRYVGQTTTTVAQRLAAHLCPSSLRKHSHLACWLRSLQAKGHKPSTSVLAEAKDQAELDQLEMDHIAFSRKAGLRLTNGSAGGAGPWGREVSTETREKLSEAQRGVPRKKKSPEEKQHLSQVMKGRTTNPPEHYEKLRLAKIGVARSEETKAKISASKKANPHSRSGWTHSEETKAKVSASRKGKLVGEGHHQFRDDISTAYILRRLGEGAFKAEIARELNVAHTFIHRRVAQAKKAGLTDGRRNRNRGV